MRIAYWTTSCLQPEIEAVSKEVFQLAAHFPDSLLFGISPHYALRASFQRRYVGFHPHFDPLLRILVPYIERRYDISHVYGAPTPWTFYKTLYRKPIVLTVASEIGAPRIEFLNRCRKVLVQTNSYYQTLLALGIEKDKLELLYPGVDLQQYRPRNGTRQQRDTPKVLFASAPRSEEEMKNRGVYLLLQAAEGSRQVQYQLLYRQWGSGYTSLAATKRWLESHSLDNVILTNDIVTDMHRLYSDHNFTIIPYTTADGGKECPMSALEGLACGLPTLISSVAPFAEFVAQHKCGVLFDPTPASLVIAVETGMRQYPELSTNAVKVARRYFSSQQLLERMTQIYEEILSR
jgi:glycosyltransferase involved in cell wall biosynthesis